MIIFHLKKVELFKFMDFNIHHLTIHILLFIKIHLIEIKFKLYIYLFLILMFLIIYLILILQNNMEELYSFSKIL
jgi:hypothetical protein